MKKYLVFTFATVFLLGSCFSISSAINADAVNTSSDIKPAKQQKGTIILDDIFKNKETSLFTEFNDPFYVTWVGADTGVILRYDPNMQNGIITKHPYYVFGGMNYVIRSEQLSNAFVRIKDVNNGEVYLSKKLPESYTGSELKFSFPRDTQISVQITSPVGGDSNVSRFTLTLADT